MGDYSSKRGPDGVLLSRKGSSVVLRDTINNQDRNVQLCTRIGCSGRLNSAKGTQLNNSVKAQSSRPLIRSTPSGKEIVASSSKTYNSGKAQSSRPSIRSTPSGKEVVGSSSRTYGQANNTRKSLPESRKKSSCRLEPDSSQSVSIQDEPDVPELECSLRKLHKGNHSSSVDTHTIEVASMQLGSSRFGSNTVSHVDFSHKSVLGNSHTLASSSTSLSPRGTFQGRQSNVSRNGLRNFRCNSVSDVVSSSLPSSDSNNIKKDTVKRRVSIGESSTFPRGKRMIGSVAEGQSSVHASGVSILDSTRARSGPPIRDNPVSSVRSRSSVNSNNYNRSQGTRNSLTVGNTHAAVSQIPQLDMSSDLSSPTSSHRFFMESSSGDASYSRPGSSSESSRGVRPSSPAEISNMRSLLNRESFRRYNMDGIAEVLLALERIEHDEELTYEQLLVLETNLFLSGLNFHDQHRDMRLDIDNMSYEELLALEDRMGSVSTAVKEEELSGCLKTGIYQSKSGEEGVSGNCSADLEDIKCSICQEEYADEEELGWLQCEHKYHMKCIEQWLRVKNWCPVCKVSAVPTTSSSSESSQ